MPPLEQGAATLRPLGHKKPTPTRITLSETENLTSSTKGQTTTSFKQTQ